MGSFILTLGHGFDEGLKRAAAQLEAAGLPPGPKVESGGITLMAFGRMNGERARLIHQEGGDFACATGTLIHGGRTGEAGLRSFLRDFDPADPWKGTLGQWTAVVCRGGAVHMLSDRLNAAKIYRDAGGRVFSNSFLALCEMGRTGGPDSQGIYEYVWNGAVFGSRTILSGIGTLPSNALAELRGGSVTVRELGQPFTLAPSHEADLDKVAADRVERLRMLFDQYKEVWPTGIRSALSGGYDSRLLLALMMDRRMGFELFVYGDAKSEDVQIAKAVCAAEGLALDHIDKGQAPRLPVEAFAEAMTANLLAFDGLKYDGIFDGGADLADRKARSAGGKVLMNGSAGEVFRNFYYLRHARFTLPQLVRAFHSRLDETACTEQFIRRDYEHRIAEDMRRAIGAPHTGPLHRGWIEMVYPLFRGRYWSARDAVINQRFGPSLYPYLEPQAFDGTWNIPLGLKNFGRLEGRMIARLSPGLASHLTAYGFPAGGPAPFAYRARMTADYWRPTWLRAMSYRLHFRKQRPRPWPLEPHYLRTVIDTAFPMMRRFFKVEKVNDPEAFNRLCTAEWLCERYVRG